MRPPSWQKYIQTLISDGIKYKEDAAKENIAVGEEERVILMDVEYFKIIGIILINTNPKVVANYMGWREVQSKMQFLNKAAEDIKQKFNKAITKKYNKECLTKNKATKKK